MTFTYKLLAKITQMFSTGVENYKGSKYSSVCEFHYFNAPI